MSVKPLQTHAVITIHRPLLWGLSFFAMGLITLFSLWVSFEYGRSVAGYDRANADAYIEQLTVQVVESKAEMIESNRQATMLVRNSKIDDDAFNKIKETLVQVNNEVSELTKELSFYKSIVAPEQGKPSLEIQSILLKSKGKGDYSYTIMVSQRGRNTQFTRGTIAVSIKGVRKGKEETLLLADVANNLKKPLKYGFKYFQNFEGVMSLPAAFQPDYLHIVVKPSTDKIKTVDEQFAWSELTAGGV